MPETLKALTVTLGDNSLLQGETTQAEWTASVTGRDAALDDNFTVTWSSSNPAVATVNPTTGVVTAVGGGTCTIRATSGAISGSVTVTVQALPTVVSDAGSQAIFEALPTGAQFVIKFPTASYLAQKNQTL